ncbi:MAG: substrate-binding domain-containing protein [Rhizobiaceae bacterium]|jgi:LacI family transcriptional regulator|nr:substrate-binding domain-containing protein [Rhizobiaceae bacterium]
MNLKELAEHLQLSQTTVSRALNGYPEVSLKTRQRVAEVARTMGYRPNHAARGLATGKARVIAVVLRTALAQAADPHYAEFLGGVGDAVLENGYDILVCPATRESELSTYRRIVQSGQADGILISSPFRSDERLALLDEMDFPYLVHGRAGNRSSPYAFLDIDNRGAFFDATRLLVQLGHSRFGLINGPAQMNFAEEREHGVREALERAGLALAPDAVSSGEMSDEYGYKSMARLLDRTEPPSAVLCSSLFIALGAVRAINDAGLAVGRDISLIAHDDVIPYLKPDNFRVPLATTRSSIRQAGHRAAKRLINQINAPQHPLEGEVWPVELIVRESISTASAR